MSLIQILGGMRILRDDQRLFDVTLVTDDWQHIQAHKIILSAGSQFFSDIFLKSNHANMLIYLKGIHSVHFEHLLDFIYTGEVSVSRDEIKKFLEIAKELQVMGFENALSSVGEMIKEEPVEHSSEDIQENKDNFTEELIVCDKLETYKDSEEKNVVKLEINVNSDLDLRIEQMIEKYDGVWICKVCGKTAANSGHLREHAETHIEGMTHVCHICNKTFPNRPCLRYHKRSKQHKKLTGNL